MRARALVPFLLAICWTVVRAEPVSYSCWVSEVEAVGDGVASIRFSAVARGVGAVVAADNESKLLSNFRLDGEVVVIGAIRTKALILERGKVALLSAGHESCKFEWLQESARSGVRITATSTYVPAGSKPHTVVSFVPLAPK